MNAPELAILVLIPGFLMQISLSVPAARACRDIAKGQPGQLLEFSKRLLPVNRLAIYPHFKHSTGGAVTVFFRHLLTFHVTVYFALTSGS